MYGLSVRRPHPENTWIPLRDGTRLGARLWLPEGAEAQPVPAFGPREHAAPLPTETTRTGQRAHTLERDMITGKLVAANVSDSGGTRFVDSGAVLDDRLVDTYTVYEGKPLSAQVDSRRQIALSRGDWRVRIETHSTMTADAQHFHVTNTLDAYEGDVRIFARTWNKRIERDCV